MFDSDHCPVCGSTDVHAVADQRRYGLLGLKALTEISGRRDMRCSNCGTVYLRPSRKERLRLAEKDMDERYRRLLEQNELLQEQLRKDRERLRAAEGSAEDEHVTLPDSTPEGT